MNNLPEHLPQLALPPLPASRLALAEGPDGRPVATILDPQRSKAVVLTPEEWVRQHFVAWLINEKAYPRSLVVNELGLRVNGRPRRADTVVFTPDLRPLMVVEYKRASVAITQKVFDQIVRYNMTFQAPYVAVSNGLRHFCCRIDFATHSYAFLREFPSYPELHPCAESPELSEQSD